MRSCGLAIGWVAGGLVSACSVPYAPYHLPDAASIDAVPEPTLDARPPMLAQQAYVKAFNTGTGDSFGQSVALSADGSTLAVGACREASNGVSPADNSAVNAGAVYVFTRSGATWSQQAYVKASNAGADDFFGTSVALSADGMTLAVGAYSEDSKATGINGDQNDESLGGAGAVYVFTRSGVTWTQQAYVKASNTGREDQFGKSIALSTDGSTLAVGAAREDSSSGNESDNSAQDAGAVYVFTRSGATWSQQAYVKAPDATAFDQFGRSVALSADGSTLAVGASSEDSPMTNYGKVYVFARSGTTWTKQLEQATTASGAIGAFGNSVALSADGSILAVGASQEESATMPAIMSAGEVYVFTRDGTTWHPSARVESSNLGAGDHVGQSVALSADGSTLVVGASSEASQAIGIDGDQSNNTAPDAGAVYVFTRGGTMWTQQSYVKASNTGTSDFFGQSVALSADGSTFAIGALAEDSTATSIDGDQTDNAAVDAGAVYVFYER